MAVDKLSPEEDALVQFVEGLLGDSDIFSVSKEDKSSNDLHQIDSYWFQNDCHMTYRK